MAFNGQLLRNIKVKWFEDPDHDVAMAAVNAWLEASGEQTIVDIRSGHDYHTTNHIWVMVTYVEE